MLAAAEDELGRIDAVAGDGDHGRGMVKGSAAAREAAAQAVGRGRRARARCSPRQARNGRPRRAAPPGCCGERCSPRSARASATPEDQIRRPWPPECATDTTPLSNSAALRPATRRCSTRCCRSSKNSSAGSPTASRGRTGLAAAADVATDAARATAEMRPKVGRARPLAERSVGTPDAGATSLAMCAAHRRRLLCAQLKGRSLT